MLAVILAPSSAAANPPPASPGVDRVTRPAPSKSPILGPRLAPVTIDLFVSLSDGGRSARAHFLVAMLRERHPMRLRVIYHLVGHSGGSDNFAEAGREAFAQGRFEAFITEFYKDGHTPPWREVDAMAAAAGLDMERFHRALRDRRHGEQVRAADRLRQRRGVLRVPGITVNGEVVWPIRSIDDLEAAFLAGDEKARRVLARGAKPSELFWRLLALHRAHAPLPVLARGRVDGMTPERASTPRPPVWVGGRLATVGHPSRGSPSAKIPVVLVCTFSSHYCAQMYYHLEDLRKAYPDVVRVVFRHAPAAADEANLRLHLAAVCAEQRGAFWQFYDVVFRRFRTRPRSDEDLAHLAQAIPLDPDDLLACVHSPATRRALDSEIAAVKAAGATVSPSVAIDGVLYDGTRSFAELRALTEAALVPGILGRLSRWPSLE